MVRAPRTRPGALAPWMVFLLLLAFLPFQLGAGCGDDDDQGRRQPDDDNDTDDDAGDDTDDDDDVDPGSIVDTDGDVGRYTSLELFDLDPDRPIISYHHADQGLKVARWEDSSWTIDVVDSGSASTGLYTSMRLNLDGDAHIAYYDEANGDLRYAFGTIEGGWDLAAVDTDGDAGRYASLSLTPSEYPGIAYYAKTGEGTGELRYAVSNGTAWTVETVDAFGDAGQYCSLGHNPSDGRVLIAYYDAVAQDLKLATREGGNWTVEALDTGGETGNVGKWASLEADFQGNIQIAYYDEGRGDLKYARFLEGGEDWSIATVDSGGTVGANADLALDTDLRPWIAYQDQDNVDVRLARNAGGGWEVTPEVVPGPYGFWLSLEVGEGAGGEPVAVFSHYHPQNKDLLIYPPRDLSGGE